MPFEASLTCEQTTAVCVRRLLGYPTKARLHVNGNWT